ncbi:MAG: hypothetical protein OXI67_11680 [Candidatus Poribacteria bacterium]|nr:hypothetical protein [Candidatus Poribacteria bacterium]
MTNEELYELMKDGFAQVNQRLDQGLENVNQRLDRVKQRLDTMDDRLRAVESGVSELKGKQSAIAGCEVGSSQHVLSVHWLSLLL